MAEEPAGLQECLALCRATRVQGGADQTDALGRLESLLASLLAEEQQRAREHGEEDAQRRYQAQILEQIHDSVITMDLGGYITSWNKGAEQLFGYTAEEALGRNILFLYADEEDDSMRYDAFLEHGGRGMEVRRRKKSGEVFWASLSLSLMRDQEGQPAGLIGYLVDITERLEIEEKLRLHARIVEDSDQGIIITDADEFIVSVNAAFSRITGYAREEAIGQTPDLLRSGMHDEDFRQQVHAAMHGNGPWQGELWGRRKNGELYPQWAAISAIRNPRGEVTHAFSIFSDISERKRNEERIHQLANYDTLTGLPNRTLLSRLVDQSLTEALRKESSGALLFINLNRFKPVNETLGHDTGDELLRQVGQRFRHSLRDEDVVARIGGDEFVIALFDVARREHAAIVAQKLLAALEAPFPISGHDLRISASIGIAVYPEDASDTLSLLRFADFAMNRAKQEGDDGYMFYSEEMNQRAMERLHVETGLRRALAQDELVLYFQPKVSLMDGCIIGAEALIRWRHPEEGLVPPGRFIPVAEETGLILDIGAWVLESACAQIQSWRLAGLRVPPIAVNLSARQFNPGLPQQVKEVLGRHAILPGDLELEITESMLMHGAEIVIGMMSELVSLGVTLSLDDFGTGFSSLSYLKRFPISTLKIDRSFVIGIPGDANDCAIVSAVIGMAHQLRHKVVAEGVEQVDQLSFLRGLGCDQMQGYLFSRPLPAPDFASMVRQEIRLKA